MSQTFKYQSGAVLVVSLVMLLLLSIISVAGMQTTTLEEKMTGNQRDRNLAFQAAESAIRAGENFLTQATLPTFNGNNGLYAQNGAPPGADANWASYSTVAYAYDNEQVASAPLYVIQRMRDIESGSSLDAGSYGQSEMYRVTARGVGGTDTAVVVIQTTYRR
ncbi:PilX N-terminal domain-containing pilus assembly protein [Methylomonas sp. SURF-2]|uniref:PilX N-terminal domain-containing pilus assembly protein n=1 Tax=Methylomonas subterranea TaxID=2952225 RepID=A0ABT1TIC1_9GAMM|nr:PilX N-terminal domain-containing pilus assembly protein [Methylomonas sp. SURF-2]MCQ8105217.1 PilX N-terminal domain-containing pilus assembly protein [Methylomonas sp. SURF-2]